VPTPGRELLAEGILDSSVVLERLLELTVSDEFRHREPKRAEDQSGRRSRFPIVSATDRAVFGSQAGRRHR
jgi:hypothetical protein